MMPFLCDKCKASGILKYGYRYVVESVTNVDTTCYTCNHKFAAPYQCYTWYPIIFCWIQVIHTLNYARMHQIECMLFHSQLGTKNKFTLFPCHKLGLQNQPSATRHVHLQINGCYIKATFMSNISTKYNVSFGVKCLPLLAAIIVNNAHEINMLKGLPTCELTHIYMCSFTVCDHAR